MEIRKCNENMFFLLRDIFYHSIHHNAKNVYSGEQLKAWAPLHYDAKRWYEKMGKMSPYVVVKDRCIVAYGDIQDDGYIDHFFVKGGMSRQGIGSELLGFLIDVGKEKGVKEIYSNVSKSAQPLFLKFGFEVSRHQEVKIGDVVIENARMVLSF